MTDDRRAKAEARANEAVRKWHSLFLPIDKAHLPERCALCSIGPYLTDLILSVQEEERHPDPCEEAGAHLFCGPDAALSRAEVKRVVEEVHALYGPSHIEDVAYGAQTACAEILRRLGLEEP